MRQTWKLLFIRGISKILLKIGKNFFLSSRFVQISKKIADLVLKSVDDEIFEIQGFKIKRTKNMRYLILAGDYETSETNLTKKLVKPGMTVFDLGANIGWFTLVMAKLVGEKGHVYAFEPDPKYFNILNENIALNNVSNVSTFQLASSNKEGITKFNLNPEFGTYVLDSKTIDENEILVKTTTLDKFCKNGKIKVDFVKMDVEGSEPKTLEGMSETIQNNPYIQIISEFHPDAINDLDSSPKEYLEMLEKNGFKIFEILENGKGEFVPIEKKKLLKIHGHAGFINIYCKKCN